MEMVHANMVKVVCSEWHFITVCILEWGSPWIGNSITFKSHGMKCVRDIDAMQYIPEWFRWVGPFQVLSMFRITGESQNLLNRQAGQKKVKKVTENMFM